MEPQEVIKELNKLKTGAPCSDVYKRDKAIEEAKEALKKQIPCKPVEMSNRSFVCGKCKQKVIRHQTYCDICGQAIDWSVDE